MSWVSVVEALTTALFVAPSLSSTSWRAMISGLARLLMIASASPSNFDCGVATPSTGWPTGARFSTLKLATRTRSRSAAIVVVSRTIVLGATTWTAVEGLRS